MEIREGYVEYGNYRTYYRIAGAEYKKTPLLMLHGGPGSGHYSFELLDGMAELDQRPLIKYDQIGCGNSSAADDKSEYTSSLWIDEIVNLREKLNLKQIHLLGHSWGGMLSLLYLLEKKPEGVLSVTLSSTLSSAALWEQESKRLIGYLSDADKKAIDAAIESGDYDSLEFNQAVSSYYLKYVRGEVKTPFKKPLTDGHEAYVEAWGPCEFKPLGNLKDYDVTDRLCEIVTPTLIISGTDDESTPFINKTMYDNLRCYKRWILLEGARHLTYADDYNGYVDGLLPFLNGCDR